MKRLLIIVPAGPTRELLSSFFASRADELVVLRREDVGIGQQLVVEDTRVLVDDEELLPAVRPGDGEPSEARPRLAALVTDSGFMWQLPMLDPTDEQWNEYAGSLDAFLRDERESASLWFSLMEIVTDRVPICINPQPAFELAAVKPWALELLRTRGVCLPPVLTTNDASAVADFAAGHEGPLLQLELGREPSADAAQGETARWIDARAAAELDLAAEPVTLQRLDDRTEIVVVAVDGRAVAWTGTRELPDAVRSQLGPAQGALAAPWATLVFRKAEGRHVLSDFSPAPDLGGWPAGDQQRVLAALAELVERRLADEGMS